MNPLSVAVDGPAGSGKSSVAREVARRLGLTHVDSGAIYRTIAWCALAGNLAPDDPRAATLVDERRIELAGDGTRFDVKVDGRVVGDEIRTPEVSRAVALYSANPDVRKRVNALLRAFSAARPIIMEGRDIGTVVLPDAGLKIFLTASPEVRARRRLLELTGRGERATFEEVLADVIERDRRDAARATAPLRRADDALLVDSSEMTREQVIERIVGLAEERRA